MENKAVADGLTGVVLERAVRRNIIAGTLGFFYCTIVLNFYLAGFARTLGLSDVEFGYMSAIPLLVFPMRLLGSYIVEHLGRRRNWFTVTVIASRLVWLLILAIPFVLTNQSLFRSRLFLALLLGSHALGVMAEPAWFSWMGDLIPEKMRARFWSRRSIYITVSGIIPVFLISVAKDTIDSVVAGGSGYGGFALVFGAAVFLGVVDIIIHYGIPEPPMTRHEKTPHPLKMLLQPANDRNFRPFLLYTGAWAFSVAILGQFGNKYMLEVFTHESMGNTLPVTVNIGPLSMKVGEYSLLALMNMLHIFAAIGGYAIWGMIADRYGAKPVLQLCTLLVCFLPLPWLLVRPGQSFTANIIPMIALFLFGGLTWTGVEVSSTSMLFGLSPRQSRSMYIAINLTVAGLCGAAAPMLSGHFMKFMTNKSVLGLNGYQVLCVLTALGRFYSRMLLYRVGEASKVTAGYLFRRLFDANPLSVFPSVYALAGPATEEEKINAVNRLGESGSRIGTQDLISHLDDPSPRVREEAVTAIVRAADPDAVKALGDRLGHGDSALDALALAALSEIGITPELQPLLDSLQLGLDPGAAKVLDEIDKASAAHQLIPFLAHADPRIRASAAQALGEIGDRRAGEPLSRLLQNEKNEHAFGSYATALSSLGEISAIWQIIPVMRNTTSVVNCRQLAVAIGNLLGQARVFYTYLDEECKVFGQRAVKITGQCRRLIGRTRDATIYAQRIRLNSLLDSVEAAYLREDWTACATGIAGITEVFTDSIFNSMKRNGKIPQDIDGASLDTLEKIFLIIADDQRLGLQLWYSAVLTPERDPEFTKLTFEGCLLDKYVLELVAEKVMGE